MERSIHHQESQVHSLNQAQGNGVGMLATVVLFSVQVKTGKGGFTTNRGKGFALLSIKLGHPPGHSRLEVGRLLLNLLVRNKLRDRTCSLLIGVVLAA